MKICIAGGTRPEWIKLAPVIWELQKKKAHFFILHTGQHYSENMDSVFFKQLNIPKPRYNLKAGSGSHGEQTGKIIIEAERILVNEKPDVVVVEGDTNSVFAVATAAVKLHIKIAHVEAGLRSNDKSMPEEVNRIMVDHISDYLFAPTIVSRQHLLREGIPSNKIFLVGNTIVDSFKKTDASEYFKKIKMPKPKYKYVLITMHRQENVDVKEKLVMLFQSFDRIHELLPYLRFKFIAHPRTLNKLKEFDLMLPNYIEVLEPVGYFEFINLEKSASLILTDSGGVQEEACILGVPCVTLRDSTERPETIMVGANLLAGVNPEMVEQQAWSMINKTGWMNPFGDGHAGVRIVNILLGDKE